MTTMLRALRGFSSSAWSVAAVSACLLGPQTASGQNQIPDFLAPLGLEGTNIHGAALAIQRTCGQLIATGNNDTGGSTQANELWRRCNELVHTAQSIVNLRPGGSGSELARTLGYSADNDLLASFQQVNGEETLSKSSLAQNGTYEQFSSIGARLGALRGGTGASITSVAANGSEMMYGSGGGAAADSPFGPWGWFIRGTYTSGERDPSDPNGFVGEENGFEYDQYGVTVGIDHMSGSRVMGFAVSYSSYELEMANRGAAGSSPTNVVDDSSIDSDNISGSFYFDYTGESNGYVTFLAGYGTQSFDLARSFIYIPTCGVTCGQDVVDQNRSLVGAPDGDSLAATLSVGKMIERGSWVIDPRIGVTWDSVTIDQFAESDTGNESGAGFQGISAMQLMYAEQEIDSFRATVGIQISNNVNTSFGSVRPTFSLDWYREFEDDPREIKVKYALEEELAGQGAFTTGFDCTVSCYSLFSEAPDSSFFVAGLGLAASYRNGFQAFLMFESLLDYDNLDSYALTLGMRGQF